jgi:hypothetical protein
MEPVLPLDRSLAFRAWPHVRKWRAENFVLLNETPSVRFTVPAELPDPYFIPGAAVNASYETISSNYKKLAKMYHPNKRQKSLTTEIWCRTTLVPKMHRVCYMCGEWPEYQCKRCNKPFCFECGYTLKDKETGKFFTACDPCIIDTDFPDDVERLVVAKTFWLC